MVEGIDWFTYYCDPTACRSPQERIWRLSARQSDFIVDDEEGNAANLMSSRPILAFLDCFHSFFTVQHGLGTSPVQARPGNDVDQRLAIGEVTAVAEVSSEQCLHDGILAILLIGKPHKLSAGAQNRFSRTFDDGANSISTDASLNQSPIMQH